MSKVFKVYLYNIFLINLILCNTIHSQGIFSDRTSFYKINHEYGNGTAGGGVSFADFDGDGLDDITMATSKGEPIYFFKNTGSGIQKLNLLPNLKAEVKHILWVDIDNDGDKDLYVAIADDYNRLYINDGKLNLSDQTSKLGLDLDNYTTYGACFGDFNRDGWLDLYYGLRRIEKDGKPNISKLFVNTGKGFNDVTMLTGTEDSGKTPFCSSFIDYNNDKWPDIYTAHDRLRGNTMLRNKKNGTFEDVSKSTGTDLKMDGMSVSTGDCNNDGFFDIYVSNSEAGNALFVNKGGEKFENQAGDKGVGFNSVAWGTNFLDGDNDGDEDLYVSGMLVGNSVVNSTYYINQFPDAKFIKGPKIPSDTVSSFNNAIGDINNDGYPDIAVMNVGPFPSFIFQNTGGNNNFLKLKLKGVVSNRDAVGSLITLYSEGKKQYRYTQCGVGFMGQNSDTELFGLGKSIKADSLTVLWPSGHIDRLYNLFANKRYLLTEGSTTSNIIKVDEDVKLLTSNVENIENSIKNDFFTVYPNPNNTNTLFINNPYKHCIKSILVMNMSGHHSNFQTLVNENDLSVDIENLASGMYILKINGCDGRHSFLKFVVNK